MSCKVYADIYLFRGVYAIMSNSIQLIERYNFQIFVFIQTDVLTEVFDCVSARIYRGKRDARHSSRNFRSVCIYYTDLRTAVCISDARTHGKFRFVERRRIVQKVGITLVYRSATKIGRPRLFNDRAITYICVSNVTYIRRFADKRKIFYFVVSKRVLRGIIRRIRF